MMNFYPRPIFALKALEPETGYPRRRMQRQFTCREGDMMNSRMLQLVIVLAAINMGYAGRALAQACSHEGPVVTCNDGRRGILSGDAIIWPDGTRSSASPHPSVIIGNKSSVKVGQGVFVGQGKGSVPLDDPNAPNKTRCAILDGVSYCY
jgi:hypothetical protein